MTEQSLRRILQHSPVWREDLANWWFENNRRGVYTGFDRDQLVGFLLRYRYTTPQPKGAANEQQTN
jgi:hypothetical protein